MDCVHHSFSQSFALALLRNSLRFLFSVEFRYRLPTPAHLIQFFLNRIAKATKSLDESKFKNFQCIFVSLANAQTLETLSKLANRKYRDIFKMKNTFISTSWGKQCLTIYNLQQKNCKYIIRSYLRHLRQRFYRKFLHSMNILDLPATNNLEKC